MIGPLPSAVSEVLGSDCGVKLSYRLRFYIYIRRSDGGNRFSRMFNSRLKGS